MDKGVVLSEESHCSDMVWEMVQLAWLEAETRRMTISPCVEPAKVREEYDRVEDMETGVAEQMLDVEEETFTNITEMIGYWEAQEEMEMTPVREMIAAKRRTSANSGCERGSKRW